MTGDQLDKWLWAERVTLAEFAEALSKTGRGVSRQQVHKWRNGAPISEYWAARVEQVAAEISAARQRAREEAVA